MWQMATDIMGTEVVHDFVGMAKLWLRGKKYNAVNVFNTAILWTIWKVRNELCFQGQC
jgi:hypothetical protein